MSMNKKIGFDIHGVIDKNPELFSEIIKEFRKHGFEIHILTGSLIDDDIIKELHSYDIEYDYLFSILGYHKEHKTQMWKDDKGWWINDDVWNMTKANYCHRLGIIFHLDDTKAYGRHFFKPIFGHITPIKSNPRILELPEKIDLEVLEIFTKYEGYYVIQMNG